VLNFVQQVIAAGDQNRAGVDTYIRADRSGVADQFNAASDGAGAEIVDQNAGADRLRQRRVARRRQRRRSSGAELYLAQFDAVALKEVGLSLTKVRNWGTEGPEAGGAIVAVRMSKPGRVQHQHMLAVGNRVSRKSLCLRGAGRVIPSEREDWPRAANWQEAASG